MGALTPVSANAMSMGALRTYSDEPSAARPLVNVEPFGWRVS